MKVPDICERVLAPVPLPKIAPTDDARKAFTLDDAALLTATAEIEQGRSCIKDQREYLASPGK